MLSKIKECCAERGISISDLEKALGFSNSSIYRWDTNAPSIEKVKAVADYFGVSVDYIIGAEERYYLSDETAEAAQKIFENKELRLLFDAAQDAEPEDLNTVHAMLLALKRKERRDEI